jgi:hypothetical protein
MGQPLQGSERPFRDAGFAGDRIVRRRELRAAAANTRGGEQAADRMKSSDAEFGPCMPAGERAAEAALLRGSRHGH